MTDFTAAAAALVERAAWLVQEAAEYGHPVTWTGESWVDQELSEPEFTALYFGLRYADSGELVWRSWDQLDEITEAERVVRMG